MNRKYMFLVFLSILAGLSLGSVRKAEDPIRDTQTNPILYKQKMEEEKDGKKGPLMYHVKNNPRESFFIDLPYEAEKKTSAGKPVTEEAPVSGDTAGWWEEQPTDPQAVPPAETVSEPLPEPLPEAEQPQNPEGAGQSVSEAESENAPAAKGDDYWW